jgi:hypothetical protein
MMTEASLSIGLIALAYFSTGAWIGSLDENDAVMDMFWCGVAYGVAGIAVAGVEGLIFM